jgi:hypothetical protein
MWDEVRAVASIGFRFQQKTSEYSYAADLSRRLQLYQDQHALSGGHLLDGLDTEALAQYLGYLSEDNMLVFHIWKEHAQSSLDRKVGQPLCGGLLPSLLTRGDRACRACLTLAGTLLRRGVWVFTAASAGGPQLGESSRLLSTQQRWLILISVAFFWPRRPRIARICTSRTPTPSSRRTSPYWPTTSCRQARRHSRPASSSRRQ